ncbi:Dephospho-CoA kinase [Nostoc flagelliforme CCNUN1]|uniref:Dephospho-CoA kinase n=1 Tax=Nostoc flagelliforme CCNUN1 TaxID=2038116 RepID=A0A2K8SIX3_9NOSO|nr:AAA family ATPase [Nostoc flagelliforme]AUB35399.1 Dephospho-CoA kinase [Nostoc flagelliforme CCNUN1]
MVRIIAIVGMPGSGKSVVASYLKDNGFPIIRFGEIIIREVEKRALPITPQNEQIVREEIRRKQGMDVCAQIALPLIKAKLLEHRLVIIDGLYSFSEYKTLKKEFDEELLVLGVFTPKVMRYQRLTLRNERPLTIAEAEKRDFLEIEKIEKGGPIAMANITIINNGSQYQLYEQLDQLLAEILQGVPPILCKV